MYNKYIGLGFVVADAELRYISTGTPVADFKVASNYKYGETEEVLFMPCTMFGKIAESVSPYLKKGTLVVVEGRLKEESWESDGVKKSKIKCVVSSVKLVNSGKKDDTAKVVSGGKIPVEESDIVPF